MPSFRCAACNRLVEVERWQDAPNRPFCSQRCQWIDLSKWFDESYRISEPLETQPDAPIDSETDSTPDDE